MEIASLLQDIGLFESEARLYLYLLEHGLSTPPQIAKGAGMARTNAYAILQRLKERELIEEQLKGKRKAYLATDPVALEQLLERKLEAVHRAVPDLRALYAAEKNKPKIQFFEGWDQVKRIFDQTLSSKEIFGVASTKQLFALEPKFFDDYRRKIKERGIVFHDILTHASGTESGIVAQSQLKELYQFKIFPKAYDDLPTDILIWDSSIALISIAPPVFGTVLTNAPLAKTLRIMFDVMWKSL